MEESLLSDHVKSSDFMISLFHASNDANIIPLGTAVPSPDLLPYQKLNSITRSISRELPRHSSEYEFPPGLESLRRQISRRLNSRGTRIKAEDIVITSGGMEAVMIALRSVTQAGDTVLVESPTFYGILQCLESLGLNILEVPICAEIGIEVDDIKKALRQHKVKAAILTPSFNNPTGSLVPDKHKQEIVQALASEGVWIIEDDIYADLPYHGSAPKPMKAYDEQDKIILVSSFSKTVAPGFRVGYIVNRTLARDFEKIKFITNVGTSNLQQLVLAEYMQSGAYQRLVKRLSAQYYKQMCQYSGEVLRCFPEGTKLSKPQGGFVLWIELDPKIDSVELYKQCLKQKISISPGIIYSASNRYRNHIRINCGHLFEERTKNAIQKIAILIKRF
jgi:DNA-binding transcriptional MocR family regulator